VSFETKFLLYLITFLFSSSRFYVTFTGHFARKGPRFLFLVKPPRRQLRVVVRKYQVLKGLSPSGRRCSSHQYGCHSLVSFLSSSRCSSPFTSPPPIFLMSRDRCPPLWIPQTPLVLLAISTEGKEILIHGGACYSRHAVIYSDPSRENQPRTSVTEFLLHLILIYPNKYLLILLSLLSRSTESRNAASYRHSLHRDNRDSAEIAGSSVIASWAINGSRVSRWDVRLPPLVPQFSAHVKSVSFQVLIPCYTKFNKARNDYHLLLAYFSLLAAAPATTTTTTTTTTTRISLSAEIDSWLCRTLLPFNPQSIPFSACT